MVYENWQLLQSPIQPNYPLLLHLPPKSLSKGIRQQAVIRLYQPGYGTISILSLILLVFGFE